MANVTTWDFTWHVIEPFPDMGALLKYFDERCAKFGFQLEKAPTSVEGGLHYQGRVRQRDRFRKAQMEARFELLEGAFWTPTANCNSKAFSYVMKIDSRVAGPWTDKDVPQAPQQKTDDVLIIEEVGMWPWQATVLDDCKRATDRKTRDRRGMNCVLDDRGGPSGKGGKIGKGTFVAYLNYHKIATRMPPINDSQKMLGLAIDFPAAAYCVDMPRAMDKKALRELWAGLEALKDGQVYDTRYKGRMEQRERCHIWVFTNTPPDADMLTVDRWNIWRVNREDMTLRLQTADEVWPARTDGEAKEAKRPAKKARKA